MGGYVLVPIVAIYGAKEVRFILRPRAGPASTVSADRYGRRLPSTSSTALRRRGSPTWRCIVVVAGPRGGNQAGARSRVLGTTSSRRGTAEEVTASDPDAVCVLAYTSGTTSDPKGVMHTHRTLLAEIPHIQSWITPGSPNLMGSPVTHATGMLGAVLAPMALGRTSTSSTAGIRRACST